MALDPLTYWPEGGRRDLLGSLGLPRLEIVSARDGIVRDPSGRTKIGIVGFCSNTRHEAPFNDPEWLLLGCNQLYRFIPRADAWTEIHHRNLWVADTVPGTDYVGWLRSQPLPVLMAHEDYDAGLCQDIPNAVRFPIELANSITGGVDRLDGSTDELDYYQSTISFQIAWALVLGAKTVGIWGVDLNTDGEYAYQKPNAEFWIGLCKGMGIKVVLPKETALLRQVTRYGRPGYGETGLITHRMIDRRREFLNAQRAKVQERVNDDLRTLDQMDAVLREDELFKEILDLKLRGGRTEYDDPLPGSA